jgi:hypothetical protein
METVHFQEEETFLFSCLLGRLKVLSKETTSLTTKCFLAIFWKIYGEKQLLESLIEDIEKEIRSYNSDPSREANRTKKVFVCAAYRAVAKKAKEDEKIQNYLSYARDSKDWLGQPRIACCLSFLEKGPINEEARKYLKDNLSPWLSEGRDDFIAVALLALRGELSRGELQRILEHVELKTNDLPLGTISLYLIGISQSNAGLPNKGTAEDRLYQAIKEKLGELSSCGEEETISAATALFLAKYSKIVGYFEKYSSDLKETLALKDEFSKVTRRAKPYNLLLTITLIATIGLSCLMFFLSSLVEFKENPSAFGRFLLTISRFKDWALVPAIVLILYILISYFKKGDPVLGVVEFLQEKFPIFKSIKEERK